MYLVVAPCLVMRLNVEKTHQAAGSRGKVVHMKKFMLRIHGKEGRSLPLLQDGSKKQAVRTKKSEEWERRMAPKPARARGLMETQPQTHTWEHSRDPQAVEKPHIDHPRLSVYSLQCSLDCSQKPVCNLWGVFTKCLEHKPLNLFIPRDEDTAFNMANVLRRFNTNLFNT